MKFFLQITLATVALWSIQKTSCGQSCKRLPMMFVPKDTATVRINEVSRAGLGGKSKLERLNNIYGMQHVAHPFIYTWNAINKLIAQVPKYDTMRIYFARYKQCDGLNFPLLTNNNFILLFSPEVKSSSSQKYYFINEKDDGNYEVPNSCAINWISEFNSTCQDELRKTISKTDPDNNDPDVPERFSDTKSIIYKKTWFEEAFIKEKEYQKTSHDVDLTAFQFSLSAYTKNGRKATDYDSHSYKRRLFIQMDYMKPGINNLYDVFYLEEENDFKCRAAISLNLKPQKLLNIPKKQIEQLLSLNNGQLCPTFCPGRTL